MLILLLITIKMFMVLPRIRYKKQKNVHSVASITNVMHDFQTFMMLKRYFVSVFYAAQCDVLEEEVFAPCHAYVSPSLYHQQCRYQACRCGSACLCTALSHYAYICGKHQITINFRAHVSECGSLVIPTSICLSVYLLHEYVQKVICLCVCLCRYGVFRWDDVSPVHISLREDVSVNQQC